MKYKCLFLQGDSQTGKSTLILKSIQPFLSVTTGFLTQRLLKESETKAFCLKPIESADASIAAYDVKKPDIFLEHSMDKWHRYEEVFETTGINLLTNLNGKKLIVLDEIGGMELLIEPFREKLYEVLSSGIPCIGVIKSYRNKAAMEKSVNLEQKYSILYQKLFRDIESNFGGIIISTNDSTKRYIESSVQTFIENAMNKTQQ